MTTPMKSRRRTLWTGLAAAAISAALVGQATPASAAQAWTSITASDASASSRLGTSAAVSTDGSTTILGSPVRYAGASPTTGNARVGAAYVYSGIPAGNNLTRSEDAILVANDTPGETVNDRFGAAVDISGDGNVAVVGAPNYSNGAGRAYVFTRTSGVWARTATITKPSSTGDLFGTSVAISDDGNRLLVGAPGNTAFTTAASSATFYSRNADGSWTLASTVTTGVTRVGFGSGVALSGDGTTAAVGAPKYYTTSGSTKTPAARVFTYRYNGTAWVATTVISDASTDTTSDFGQAVSLSSAGTSLLIGAPGVDKIGTTFTGGAGYVYTGSAGTWNVTSYATLTASVSSATYNGAQLGAAVAISPDGLGAVLGAPYGNGISVERNTYGAALQYVKTGTSWSTPRYIAAVSGSAANTNSGSAVGYASNNRVVVGSPGRTVSGYSAAGGGDVIDIT